MVKIISSLRSPRGITVRYMFPILMGFGVVMAANTIVSENSSYIRLESDKRTIEAGDSFSLDVYAFAHVPVNAVDITLRFNKDDVEIISVDRGQSVLTIWTEDPIIERDRVILRGGTFRNGFLGEHKVATIEMQANQTGPSEFSVADVLLLAGDGQGTPVSLAETTDSKVNLYIYDENTAPEDIGIDVRVKILTDIDGDGRVTLRDISAFMAAWTSRGKVFDFNNDGRMTFRDFSIILASYFFQ